MGAPVEQQVTWSSASSVTVSSSSVVRSDPILIGANDWDGSITVSVDNAGTPASGDLAHLSIQWTNGDVLGDSGDDFDTDEHAEVLGTLDTFASNTPGEDPARRTYNLYVQNKTGFRLAVSCPQAATRNIVVRARVSLRTNT